MRRTYKPLPSFPSTLPREVNQWFNDHVEICVIPSEETEYIGDVTLTPGGYRIRLADKGKWVVTPFGRSDYLDGWEELDEEQRGASLLHEAHHILRGDCIAARTFPGNQRIMNIAEDCVINELFRCRTPEGFWFYRDLTPYIPELPKEYIPSAKRVYEALMRYLHERGVDPDMIGTRVQVRYEYGKKGQADAEAAHAKAVTDAAAGKVGEAFKNAGLTPGYGIGRAMGGKGRKKVKWPPVRDPVLDKVLLRVQRAVRGKGQREPKRTYTRPGRVKGLRGQAVLPKPVIVAALDVSGSFVHEAKTFYGGVLTELHRRYRVEAYTFSVGTWPFRPDYAVMDGGGTAVQPVWAVVEHHNAAAVVCVTDCLIDDVLPLPRCPVIWVVPPDAPEVTMRPGDYRVEVPKK